MRTFIDEIEDWGEEGEEDEGIQSTDQAQSDSFNVLPYDELVANKAGGSPEDIYLKRTAIDKESRGNLTFSRNPQDSFNTPMDNPYYGESIGQQRHEMQPKEGHPSVTSEQLSHGKMGPLSRRKKKDEDDKTKKKHRRKVFTPRF